MDALLTEVLSGMAGQDLKAGVDFSDIDAALAQQSRQLGVGTIPEPPNTTPVHVEVNSTRTMDNITQGDLPPPPPPPDTSNEEDYIGSEQDSEMDLLTLDDPEDRQLLKILEVLQERNRDTERLVRRQGTALSRLVSITKKNLASHRTKNAPKRISVLKKCRNCQRINRRTTLCGPQRGGPCKYCVDHGITCEGPAVDGRFSRKR